jgi:hypothetical protein
VHNSHKRSITALNPGSTSWEIAPVRDSISHTAIMSAIGK